MTCVPVYKQQQLVSIPYLQTPYPSPDPQGKESRDGAKSMAYSIEPVSLSKQETNPERPVVAIDFAAARPIPRLDSRRLVDTVACAY